MVDAKVDSIPLTFMLGFFVTVIVDRWRQVYGNIPLIENVAFTLVALRGSDKRTVLQRRTIIRYIVVAQILVFRDISMRVRRRFPSMESLVAAGLIIYLFHFLGFLHEHELCTLQSIDINYDRYWAPVNWSLTIIMDGVKNGKVDISNINFVFGENFRTKLEQMCNFDWVPIPIAYPQVVFLAVRVYFVICLLSRQYLLDGQSLDLYVPFDHPSIQLVFFYILTLCLVFLVGWMKVAEALLNPLGEDDDDFECNFLIDKNIATGLAIVDKTYDRCPELIPDKFMNSFKPIYSDESVKHCLNGELIGSAETVKLAEPTEEVRMVQGTPYLSTYMSTGELTDIPLRFSDRIGRRFTTSGHSKKTPSRCISVDFRDNLPHISLSRGVGHSFSDSLRRASRFCSSSSVNSR